VFGPLKTTPITITDVRDAKWTRQFTSIADMAEEQKNVRVWGGVHYWFAIRTSEGTGQKLAAYMVENTLKPAR
jgi:hypothetical protein